VWQKVGMADLRWPTYPSRGVTLDAVVANEGRGSCHVRDTEGKVYLDAIGGIGCIPIGHSHPAWVKAISEQLGTLAASANSFHTKPQLALSKLLCESFPISDARVFFGNTGTEATEAAIKLALRATGRDVIVAFEGAFHGRTLASLSLTANPKYREPYLGCDDEEAAERFARFKVRRLPFNDLDALAKVFQEDGGRIAAVFMEPIQGEGGIFPATKEFLLGARELCTKHGALLGMDEIQSGVGRTGEWAAWTAIAGADVEPDIIWLAKALGGGFPIGACLTRAELAESMSRGSHGTTFGGNAVACAAGLATMGIIEAEGLRAQAAQQIGIVRELATQKPISAVTEIRGVGAMIGIQIGERSEGRAAKVGSEMMARGVLATVPGGHTIRLLLPYFAGREELGQIWDVLAQAVEATG
jgi:acetylornithine/succinyldiaminopimelate/putrescine aminotransferase